MIAFKNIHNQEDCIMRTRQFSTSLSVALPSEHLERIKQITDKQQISMAEWVREAVSAALNNIKREEDTM
jgi:predicted DNA-binding protein